MTNRSSILFTLLICASALHAQQEVDRILARAGTDVITESEFRQRFELLPRRLTPGSADQLAAKEDLLLSMIAEKLLAQEAVEEGLERDSLYRAEMESVRRLLARDQLYRLEVQRKIHITPDEVREGVKHLRRVLLVEYAFADDSLLLAGYSFVRDSLSDGRAGILRDTITVRWGEAEPALERAVFAIESGIQTQVTPSSLGWFVCRILSETSNEDAQRLGPLELRDNVERTLRLRKEEARLDEYMQDVLKRSSGRATGRGFRALAGALRSYGYVHPPVITSGLTGSDRESLRRLLGSSADDTLLVFQHQMFSVIQVVDRLISTGFRPETTAYPQLEQRLNTILRVWAWQGILEELALEQGLDSHPEVDRQLQMWKTYALAETVRRRLISAAMVTDAELHRYRRSLDPFCQVPRGNVDLVWASADSLVTAYLERLAEEGAGDGDLGTDTDTCLGHRSLVNHELVDLGMLADALSFVPVGEWTRSIHTDTAYVAARMTSEPAMPELPGYERDSLMQRLRDMKGRRAEVLRTAFAAASKGYTVFEDRLRELPVSSLPMMTFRLLGFGGRMFAAPFVRPRTEWYSVEQEQGKVLP